ncbi:MAG: type I glyceraldehyde-3-phosphate dehydrogenase [Candidatus Nealsonbacteria bacterium CG_4_10_14_0_2_um_filter_38_17]|uniref:Type I glyceraldehyde-3-phosphate dehydrogenase n=2 Tax=Candidatus Nealsoniibacteriota TaxID=1817911 RepID=A0A2M7UYG6_9BACT|nr:MAG: type I glyceraldehyde-3-phosphate dehydrogenase [Candidatus Nealsonbacteria bacterium CG23_combo_of_CG06-09_8_20_14_all_38_19]PIZ89026.1 MAG: type I glyceraldehyde-3-phosphate dehydrogenase [Candidatus Nealsonbacteria bacterium CG_4_10_14_0_2_um_filter_38_17]
MVKIAINGFGRIGRSTLKKFFDNHSELELVAVNDLTDAKTLAHLLRYDSVYGIYKKAVKFSEKEILVDGTSEGGKIMVFAEIDPLKLPWRDLGIDIVLECTGNFSDYEGAKKHLEAGAKKVIISTPSKNPDKIPSFVLGVNEEKFDPKKHDIVDMGSCTTNCLAPVAKVLNENFKIVRGFMTTVHSYTNDQRILDLPHKDLRRARAADLNIIPTSTGAAKAIGNVIPELKGKLDGLAFRVPTPTVSVLDLVCQVKKKATAEEINYTFKKASEKPELKGILGIEDASLVSSDYIGNSFSAVVDSQLTSVIDDLVKVVAWYDNEWAYACRLAEFAEYVGEKL